MVLYSIDVSTLNNSNMFLLLYNSDGDVEIRFQQCKTDLIKEILFTIEIWHHPFMANLNVWYSIAELNRFAEALKSMSSFQLYDYTFTSIEREVIISLSLETTGHINANVRVYAGSRGSLRYSFEFDQSFINSIVEQITNLLCQIE